MRVLVYQFLFYLFLGGCLFVAKENLSPDLLNWNFLQLSFAFFFVVTTFLLSSNFVFSKGSDRLYSASFLIGIVLKFLFSAGFFLYGFIQFGLKTIGDALSFTLLYFVVTIGFCYLQIYLNKNERTDQKSIS